MKKAKGKCIVFLIVMLLFTVLPIGALAKDTARISIIKAEDIAQALGGEGVTISNVRMQGEKEQLF